MGSPDSRVDQGSVDWRIFRIALDGRLASLHDLQTIYDVGALFDMHDVLDVEADMRQEAEDAARKKG